MKRIVLGLVAVAMAAALAGPAFAHCEVPCGIYGDKMRFEMIEEHIATIEKAMKQIVELGGKADTNYNQIVRWTTNKEKHAEELQHIVNQYFLTQRIKPTDDADARAKYLKHLELCHHLLVYAMKCKQGTDTGNTAKLMEITKEFRASYLGPEGEAHTH